MLNMITSTTIWSIWKLRNGLYFHRIGWRSIKMFLCSITGLLLNSLLKTRILLSDEFFCVFFSLCTEKYYFFSEFHNILIEKYKKSNFSVRDNSHTEKIYTHRKILIFLTGFLDLTEKYYARTEIHLLCGFI